MRLDSDPFEKRLEVLFGVLLNQESCHTDILQKFEAILYEWIPWESSLDEVHQVQCSHPTKIEKKSHFTLLSFTNWYKKLWSK